MAKEIIFKKTTYLRVNGNGQLYNSVSEPKEGYTEFISSQGNISYRKLFSGTEDGKLTGLSIDEKDFATGKVKYLSLTIENKDAKDVVQIPLKTQKGGLMDLVKTIAVLLPNVDFSRDLTLSFRSTPNGDYKDRTIFINYVNNGVREQEGVKFAHKFGKEGDIPMPTQKQGIDGIVYDFTEQDTYLYNILISQLERFLTEKKSRVNTSTESTTPEPAQNETPATQSGDTDGGRSEEDDLPF